LNERIASTEERNRELANELKKQNEAIARDKSFSKLNEIYLEVCRTENKKVKKVMEEQYETIEKYKFSLAFEVGRSENLENENKKIWEEAKKRIEADDISKSSLASEIDQSKKEIEELTTASNQLKEEKLVLEEENKHACDEIKNLKTSLSVEKEKAEQFETELRNVILL
jgi:hypothetical protein